MLSAQLNKPTYVGDSNSELNSLIELKHCLNKEKARLDKVWGEDAKKTMKFFDAFRIEKHKIARMHNIKCISNAWLKCYELLNYFELLTEDCVYFDNASFPGSFILATLQYAKLKKINIEWHASSLIESTEENAAPLEDRYNLYKNHKGHWMMDEKNNGDVTNYDNIINFGNKFKRIYGIQNPIKLYTCDLGFDAASDYNNQEMLHHKANVGQIICGLHVLAAGGNMVVKHYTLFEQQTRSYLALLTLMFEKVIVAKPMSSKRTNSETYLVCQNYTPNKKYYDAIVKLLDGAEPFFSEKDMTTTTESIYKISKKIFHQQITSLRLFHDILSGKKSKQCCFGYNQYLLQQYKKLPIVKCDLRLRTAANTTAI